MSTPFYDLASLVVVPSGYKAAKIYAQKPLTTDGQIAFTRASTATRVNASGLIEAVASGVPRLDYLGSTCPRLLLEPQRTNLWVNSEDFSGGTQSIVTYTANTTDTLDPAGYNGADKFAVTTSGGDAHTRILRNLAVQAFTVSLYVKGAAGQKVQLFLARDGFTEIKTAPNYTLNGSWQRLTFSDTFSATSSSVVLGIEFGWTSSDSVAGQLYYLWGCQVEAGAYATSYIPTLGTSVTRVADAASKTGISSLIGQTEGTIYFEYPNFNSDFNSGLIGIDDGSGNNRILFYSDTNNRITAQVRTNGVTQQPASYSVSGDVKVAIAYDSTGFVFYVNGTLRFTGTAVVFSSTMSVFTYNHVGVGSSITNQALLFKTRLTNTQLAELTSL